MAATIEPFASCTSRMSRAVSTTASPRAGCVTGPATRRTPARHPPCERRPASADACGTFAAPSGGSRKTRRRRPAAVRRPRRSARPQMPRGGPAADRVVDRRRRRPPMIDTTSMAPGAPRIPWRIETPSNAGPAAADVAKTRPPCASSSSVLVPRSISSRESGRRGRCPAAIAAATASPPTWLLTSGNTQHVGVRVDRQARRPPPSRSARPTRRPGTAPDPGLRPAPPATRASSSGLPAIDAMTTSRAQAPGRGRVRPPGRRAPRRTACGQVRASAGHVRLVPDPGDDIGAVRDLRIERRGGRHHAAVAERRRARRPARWCRDRSRGRRGRAPVAAFTATSSRPWMRDARPARRSRRAPPGRPGPRGRRRGNGARGRRRPPSHRASTRAPRPMDCSGGLDCAGVDHRPRSASGGQISTERLAGQRTGDRGKSRRRGRRARADSRDATRPAISSRETESRSASVGGGAPSTTRTRQRPQVPCDAARLFEEDPRGGRGEVEIGRRVERRGPIVGQEADGEGS